MAGIRADGDPLSGDPHPAPDARSDSRTGIRAGESPGEPGRPELSARFTGWLYPAVVLVMRGAVHVLFRHVIVHHRERFPAHGAVLLVANHPAMWTDVVVLHTGLRRRLHFIAQAKLFRPPARGWVLRLYGSLPIVGSEEAPDARAANDPTFAACHQLFDRGEVVASFPEGTSVTDRRFQPLKTGSARVALSYDAARAGARPLAVVPVGIHYEDRTAFRSQVEITVGPAVDLAPFRDLWRTDAHAAARELTQRFSEAIARLVVNVSDAEMEALVHELEPIVLPHWHAAEPRASLLELAQGLADTVEHVRRLGPEQVDALWRRVKMYRRSREALGLSDRALRESIPRKREWLGVIARGALAIAGLIPFLIATAIHILPHLASNAIISRVAPESNRVAFARFSIGGLIYPVTYALWAWLLWRDAAWPLSAIAALLAVGALAGFVTIPYVRWLHHERMRLKLRWRMRHAADAVARARFERAALIEYLDVAHRAAQAASHPSIPR